MIYLKGLIALILAVANVLVLAVPFFSAVLLKIITPFAAGKRFFTALVTAIARQYNRHNGWIFSAMSSIKWCVKGLDKLDKKRSYLVFANHQSWADIPVLQHILEPHIPLLKFFLKKELIWVPVLGAAWWALDFPFMKRYTKEYLAKHPEKRGQDLLETKRMCERFKHSPVSVMNFLEGTRFTQEKHDHQQSPYQHLLKPKAGGAALVVSSMGENIDTLVDVSLHYQVDGELSVWKLFTGQVSAIDIQINQHPIPGHFKQGDYENDPVYREEFKQWIDQIWQEKDAWLDKRLDKSVQS
ncbi:MAG: acyltransferase [Oleiphilaceae bacterium]|nr:acyltransferase [Oleiphilaceae bacterium]